MFKNNFLQIVSVELCASFVSMGHKMGFPAGVMQEYFGSRALSAFASVITAVSWLLLYMTLTYPDMFSTSVYLLCTYFFFIGKYDIL